MVSKHQLSSDNNLGLWAKGNILGLLMVLADNRANTSSSVMCWSVFTALLAT